jgi:hypothetical protein
MVYYNTNELKEGVLNGSVPSAFVDCAVTSSIGTNKDQSRNAFVLTGQQSDKAFCMPNGPVETATAMDEVHHELQPPTKDVHIVPAIQRDSLISITKFVDANYTAIFDKDKENIYNATNTKITVTGAAIL